MEVIKGLYLDTNVFIAMAEGSTAISSQLYEFTKSQPLEKGFLFTSELSLAELLVHPYRHQEVDLARLYEGWFTSGRWFSVVPVGRSALLNAARVRAQHSTIKLPDAIHLSTAIESHCTHFLTSDKRLPEQIELRDQAEGTTAGPPRLTVLRLSPETVGDIIQGRRQS